MLDWVRRVETNLEDVCMKVALLWVAVNIVVFAATAIIVFGPYIG